MEVAEDLTIKSSTKSHTRKTGSRKKRRKQSEPKRLSLKFDDFSDKTGPSWSSKHISEEEPPIFAKDDSDGDSGILSLNPHEVREAPFSISRSSSEIIQTDFSEEETHFLSSDVDEVCTGSSYVIPSQEVSIVEDEDTQERTSLDGRDAERDVISTYVEKKDALSHVNWQHKIFRTNDSYGRSRKGHVYEAARHEQPISFIKSTNLPENEFDTIRFERSGPQSSLVRPTTEQTGVPANHEINNNNALRRTSKKTNMQHVAHGHKGLNRSRRIVANARERNRVHTISAAFEGLRRAVPCYSHNQKLSKLAILRIACSYILALANLADLDYSPNQKKLSFSECVDLCTMTLQAEGRSKRKKTQD